MLVVALGIGALALTAAGDERQAPAAAPKKKQQAADLPPLPEMRPKVAATRLQRR